MSQASEFLQGEADSWFRRNRDKMERPDTDLLLKAIESAGLRPSRVLEIGCSNGWRLNEIAKKYRAECFGVEPSGEACNEARERFPNISVNCGTAKELLFREGEFDLVIYGFMLYVADRNDLLQIASEGNRVLKDSGYLAIFDFYPPTYPQKTPYKHLDRLYSYKLAHAKLWESTGFYRTVRSLSDGQHYVEIMQKDLVGSYPEAV